MGGGGWGVHGRSSYLSAYMREGAQINGRQTGSQDY